MEAKLRWIAVLRKIHEQKPTALDYEKNSICSEYTIQHEKHSLCYRSSSIALYDMYHNLDKNLHNHSMLTGNIYNIQGLPY